MEPSFSSRVQDVFGALEAGPLLDDRGHAPATFWTVRGPQARDPANQRKAPVDVGLSNDESEGEEDSDKEDWEGEEEEDEDDGRASKRKRPISCEQFKLGVGGEKEDPEEEFESSKKMVGMDDTLDFEEEEDEFDRVAEGIDLAGSWLHAKEMTRIHTDMDFLTESRRTVSRAGTSRPSALKKDTGKRSRSALTEDSVPALEETRGTQVEDRNGGGQEPTRDLDTRVSKIPRISSSMKSASSGQQKLREGGAKSGRNSTRHVRFAVDEENGISEESRNSGSVQGPAFEGARASQRRDRYSTVPDYVKNPSKYTYYSLDWSEEDEDGNNRAALRDLQQANDVSSHQLEANQTPELPKSVTFIARSKPSNGKGTLDHDSDTKMVETHQQSEGHEDKRSFVQVTAHFAEEQLPESGDGEVDASMGNTVTSSAENSVDKALRRYRNRNKAAIAESAMEIG